MKFHHSLLYILICLESALSKTSTSHKHDENSTIITSSFSCSSGTKLPLLTTSVPVTLYVSYAAKSVPSIMSIDDGSRSSRLTKTTSKFIITAASNKCTGSPATTILLAKIGPTTTATNATYRRLHYSTTPQTTAPNSTAGTPPNNPGPTDTQLEDTRNYERCVLIVTIVIIVLGFIIVGLIVLNCMAWHGRRAELREYNAFNRERFEL